MDIKTEDLIVKYLLEGKTQSQISAILKEQQIEPNSLSYIEKTLKKLKVRHKAKTMFHLGAVIAIKRYFTSSIRP